MSAEKKLDIEVLEAALNRWYNDLLPDYKNDPGDERVKGELHMIEQIFRWLIAYERGEVRE